MKKIKLFSYVFIWSALSIQLYGCVSFTDNKGIGINYDRRTAGTIIDDQGSVLRVDTALTRDKELWKQCHINTLSYNNSILLVGQAPTDELKDRAERIAHKFFGKGKVYNQITIDEPSAFTTRTKDTWITTQVKGKLLANKNIGINRTKLVTENGIVYLMGILTKEEEALATKLASETPDVKQVIKIITEHEVD